MNEPLDDAYLRWLCDFVTRPGRRAKSRSYTALLRKMYVSEFVWLIPNDDNRIEDGKALRRLFLEQTNNEAEPDWLDLGCSFLEMLIGLALHLAFNTDNPQVDWFWHLVDNIGLLDYNDRDYVEAEVGRAIDGVVWRTYNPDGSRGLFPLRDPHEDQTRVELWYQMSAYLLELE